MATVNHPKIYLYRQIVQAKLFIDNSYTEPIDLAQIAGRACFSKFHFARLFKHIYGQTPFQYLTRLRIEAARELLSMDKTVNEVCHSVGFESLSTFSGLFKRVTGFTPSAYWRQQQELKIQLQKKPLGFIPGCFAEKKGWTQKSNIEEVLL